MTAPNAYEITVKGFDPVIEVARTPGRARANSWRSYTHCHEVTFGQFLKLSSIRKVQPTGFKRILVQGKPAWQTGSMQGNSIPFFYDDGDHQLWSHYLDVEDAASNEGGDAVCHAVAADKTASDAPNQLRGGAI